MNSMKRIRFTGKRWLKLAIAQLLLFRGWLPSSKARLIIGAWILASGFVSCSSDRNDTGQSGGKHHVNKPDSMQRTCYQEPSNVPDTVYDTCYKSVQPMKNDSLK